MSSPGRPSSTPPCSSTSFFAPPSAPRGWPRSTNSPSRRLSGSLERLKQGFNRHRCVGQFMAQLLFYYVYWIGLKIAANKCFIIFHSPFYAIFLSYIYDILVHCLKLYFQSDIAQFMSISGILCVVCVYFYQQLCYS